MRIWTMLALWLAAALPQGPAGAAPLLPPGLLPGRAAPGPPPEPMPVVPGPESRGMLAPRCPAAPGGACTSPFDGMPIFNHPHLPKIIGPRPSCLPPGLQPPRPWSQVVPVARGLLEHPHGPAPEKAVGRLSVAAGSAAPVAADP